MGIASLLSERATIRRAAARPGNAGEAEIAWNNAGLNVPCRVERQAVEGSAENGGVAIRVRARAYFPAGTDLRADGMDRVVVYGTEWRVSSVRLEGGGRERLLVAELWSDQGDG